LKKQITRRDSPHTLGQDGSTFA